MHDSFYDEFLREFKAFAADKVVGNGLDEDTDIGPVQNTMQYTKLLGTLAEIRDNGYTVALGRHDR